MIDKPRSCCGIWKNTPCLPGNGHCFGRWSIHPGRWLVCISGIRGVDTFRSDRISRNWLGYLFFSDLFAQRRLWYRWWRCWRLCIVVTHDISFCISISRRQRFLIQCTARLDHVHIPRLYYGLIPGYWSTEVAFQLCSERILFQLNLLHNFRVCTSFRRVVVPLDK